MPPAAGSGLRCDVLVVGSINTDLVVTVPSLPQAGETVLGDDLRRIGGGKGANQAVAAARLGARTALLGCVGADAFGKTRVGGARILRYRGWRDRNRSPATVGRGAHSG